MNNKADERGLKVCIYTAIFGNYDDLKEQPEQTVPCDFICFTDSPTLQAPGWEIRRIKGNPRLHPRLQAKYYKLMCHRLFRAQGAWGSDFLRNPKTCYDITIWIDGSIAIESSRFAEEVVSCLDRYGMAMVVHPDRDCIYDEVSVCRDFPKYRNLPLQKQADYYKKKGYPEKNGLMAAGLIARDMRKKKLTTINRQWWNENLRWTYQDQLSLPFILWKNRYGYDPINLNLWNNHLFSVKDHHSHL